MFTDVVVNAKKRGQKREFHDTKINLITFNVDADIEGHRLVRGPVVILRLG